MAGVYRDYDKIIEIYNASGSKDAQAFIQDTYGTQNPRCLISRMKKSEKFGYDKASQKFMSPAQSADSSLFLDLDDLCQELPQKPDAHQQEELQNDLYQQLIQEKLLLLLHYVKLDSVGRMMTINKKRLTTDGYQLKLE